MNSEPSAPSPRSSPFARIDARRSLGMLAAGAIIGLGLAGYSLFNAPGSAPTKVPTGAVALVNGRLILKRDLESQAAFEYSKPTKDVTPAEFKEVLDNMIREELLVQRGLEIDVAATDPDVRQAMVDAVNLVTMTEIEARQPSEEELKTYYDQHKDKYFIFGSMQLRDLVLPPTADEAEAHRIVIALREQMSNGKLDTKTPIEALATRYGLKDSGRFIIKNADGSTGYDNVLEPVVERTLGEPLYAAVFVAPENSVTDAVRMPDGWHIDLVFKHQAKTYQPYAQVRGMVQQNIKADAATQAEKDAVKNLRSKATILIAPGFGE